MAPKSKPQVNSLGVNICLWLLYLLPKFIPIDMLLYFCPRFFLTQGWVSRRSQLKSLFSFTNYRERWLELSRASLMCYDGQKPDHRKEKDRVNLKDVRLIETVSIRSGGGSDRCVWSREIFSSLVGEPTLFDSAWAILQCWPDKSLLFGAIRTQSHVKKRNHVDWKKAFIDHTLSESRSAVSSNGSSSKSKPAFQVQPRLANNSIEVCSLL